MFALLLHKRPVRHSIKQIFKFVAKNCSMSLYLNIHCPDARYVADF